MKIYLAGPIRGLTYEDCTEWREYAAQRLNELGHTTMSPMRGKEYLKSKGLLLGDNGRGSFEEFPMSSMKGIFGRDIFDVKMSDVLLANFAGATHLSIGTCMEVQRGYDLDKYVLTVLEPGSVHDHPFIHQASSLVVTTLDMAIDVLTVLGEPFRDTKE